MHINKLTMTHFRGASSLPLELHDRLNVFVGANGTGKSSVLDAAAIMLSWLVNQIGNNIDKGRHITDSDIQNDRIHSALEMSCFINSDDYWWKIAKPRNTKDGRRIGPKINDFDEIAKKFQSMISVEHMNLPIMVYFPVNRGVADIPLKIKDRSSFEIVEAYEESLSSSANFKAFFEWFRAREDLENEAMRDLKSSIVDSSDPQYPDPQLETVRNALIQFMPEFTNLTVRRSPLRMEVLKNGKPLTVNQLSDGEKCLMAMIGDLARRMAITNPLRNDPLQGEGVVLIDEIDLHLHPKWQRMVVPRLLEVFPNCQFLISTHSPHIITHVQPENLFLLTMTEEGLTSHPPSYSYGKTVERVLEDLMGLETTRPDEVSDTLRKIYDQIDKGQLEESKEAIDKLRNRIGEDPDLVKASVLIKRKELIGK
jgi:predicted ATP-binding protein involved in virulence